MTALNVRIPEPLADFVTRQAAEEGFRSTDAYVLALIQTARKNAARARVETLLLEGLDSGEPIEVNEAFWEEKHRRLRERFPDEDGS